MMKRIAAIVTLGLLLAGCNRANQDDPYAIRPAYRITEADPPTEMTPAISADTYHAAGELALAQGRIADGIANFRKALRVDPNREKSVFALAYALTMNRQFDQAMEFWERYVTVTHGDARSWANLARCHELAGHWKEAELAYLSALKQDPTEKFSLVSYGILLAKRDRLDEAQDYLSKALTPAQVQYNLASVAELKGDIARARQGYQEALRLDPSLSQARTRLAKLRD
jgi:tetratricopeptide (TPR) repeat protein